MCELTAKTRAGERLVLLAETLADELATRASEHDREASFPFASVDALKRAGKSPTRASLLQAATHLSEVNPFMRPGITITTSPTDYYPISKAQLVRYDKVHWVALGPLVSARG